MAPVTVLIVTEHRANLEHVRGAARSEVAAIARLVAEQHQRAVDTARGTLLAIARLPAVRDFDSAKCVEALSAIGVATELWANLGAARADGQMFCSAFPMPGAVDLSDRAFFQGAVRTGDVAAGTHVIGSEAGVAAIGNVFTHPAHRRRGFGGRVSGAVVQELLRREIPTIVLNVAMDNDAALGLYRGLGFMPFCGYYEGVGELAAR